MLKVKTLRQFYECTGGKELSKVACCDFTQFLAANAGLCLQFYLQFYAYKNGHNKILKVLYFPVPILPVSCVIP